MLRALKRLDETADAPVAPAKKPVPPAASKPDVQERFDAEAGRVTSTDAGDYDELVFTDDEPADAVETPERQAAEEHPAPEPLPAVPAETDVVVEPAPAQGGEWTSDDDEELSDGVSLGLDVDELADHLDRPVAEVEARLKKLNLG